MTSTHSTPLRVPAVAWPTLAVFAGAMVTWSLGIVLGVSGRVNGLAAILLVTLAAYAAFTPLHEATHRAIARTRWVNEVVGRIAAIPFGGPFLAVRHFHLEHHKHTNESDRDPDHWSGRGPCWLLPLRWMTQDLHYYVLYARMLRTRPRRERVEALVTVTLVVGVVALLMATGHARAALLFWLLPTRLAVGLLAFAFDWLPHRPHLVPAKIDRFRATSAFEGRLVFILSFGQSLHLVHHLFPAIPFYRYGRVWRAGLCKRSHRA
jgi:beta-carotene hydroxylase